MRLAWRNTRTTSNVEDRGSEVIKANRPSLSWSIARRNIQKISASSWRSNARSSTKVLRNTQLQEHHLKEHPAAEHRLEVHAAWPSGRGLTHVPRFGEWVLASRAALLTIWAATFRARHRVRQHRHQGPHKARITSPDRQRRPDLHMSA